MSADQGKARSGEASGSLSAGLQAAREREGSEPGREERKRGKWHGVQGSLQGSSRRQSGRKQEVAGAGVSWSSTQLLLVTHEEGKSSLQKAPSLWGVFQGKNKTAQILYKSIIGICLKLWKTSGAFLLISKTLNYFYLTL
jgi:hypothetical protein